MSMFKFLVFVTSVFAAGILAQESGTRLGTVKRGGRVSFEPTGPGVLFDALDPVIRKWYVPQELYAEYGWDARSYSNYATQLYQRYVSTSLEGDYFYDIYGNYLMRGWLIYDWRQENPQPFGSTLRKSGRFSSWFSNLLIASDHKGQYHYAITIGNQIRSSLTPMTFSKPLFDGLQWDFMSDKYSGTILMSRINEPGVSGANLSQQTDNTNLIGGRIEVQVGDFVKVGGTFVNSHQAYTQMESFGGDMLKGALTGPQNFSSVERIQIRISDDSPEDGDGGGALFASDIVIYNRDGIQTRGSEIGFRPLIEGGFQRSGYLAANGSEQIVISYNFTDRSYAGPDVSDIERAVIELVIANDYMVEIASDRQGTFLLLARASGNVKDNSNQRVVAFDYGIPTANQIAGFTFEVDDLSGFRSYLEVNVNHQFRQYPNPNLIRHFVSDSEATAWLLNISRTEFPYYTFAEFFSVNPNYATHMYTVDRNSGMVDFENRFFRYEFVDDNDDQDRLPDWRRKGWESGDREVFPGWDENNDFISDFNQNDNEDSPNLIPDYEEPFLRFHTDRPEFLYGIDMNHNGTIDRFENDELADLPYPRDLRGYNLNSGLHIGSNTRFTLGRLRSESFTSDQHNNADYLTIISGLVDRRYLSLRLFQDLRKVKDTIPNDLFQWIQSANTRGSTRLVSDLVAATDTWINTTWIGLELNGKPGLRMESKLKWQFYNQLGDRVKLALRGLRSRSKFLGVVNKIEYLINFRKSVLITRWKGEYIDESPISTDMPIRREFDQFFSALMRLPILRSSFIECGVEYERFSQLRTPTPGGLSDDFRGLVSTAQLSNVSEYQGYRLTTTIGMEVARRNFEFTEVETRTRGFVAVYAGVE